MTMTFLATQKYQSWLRMRLQEDISYTNHPLFKQVCTHTIPCHTATGLEDGFLLQVLVITRTCNKSVSSTCSDFAPLQYYSILFL